MTTVKTGYEGSYFNCTDIDECGSGAHECHFNANCENQPGTYTCNCPPGLFCRNQLPVLVIQRKSHSQNFLDHKIIVQNY